MIHSTHLEGVELARRDRVRSPDGHDLYWSVVAYSGSWRGYRGDQSFELDRETFSTVVRNFRANPRYRPDHSSDVLHWDLSHHSELPPADQPRGGAEIIGWSRELEVRTGTGGRAELWSLVRWLERGQELVRGGQAPFASISIIFDAIDPVSGEHVGPALSSIAATPAPFLEGLPRLAASRTAPQGTPTMKIDLSSYDGRNKHERARSYLAANSPGYDKLSRERQFELAFELAKQPGVITGDAVHAVVGEPEPPPVDPSDKRPVLDLSTVVGRNRWERVVAALERREGPSFARLPWDERFRIAGETIRTHRVIGG